MNPTAAAAAATPSAFAWSRPTAVDGEDPFKSKGPELNHDLCRVMEPKPASETAAALASRSSIDAWPLRETDAVRRAQIRLHRRLKPELKIQAKNEPRAEAPYHAISSGTYGHSNSGPASVQSSLYSLVAFPLAAEPTGSKSHLRQNFSSLILPPLRQEIGETKVTGPILLQNSSEVSSAPFQVQIAQILGKTILQWANPSDLVQILKANLEHRFGIPSALQRIIYQGKQLDDSLPLSFYSIKSNSSLVFSFRLRGGAAGQASSAHPFSYKEAVRSEIPVTPEPPKPKPFLVDKLEEVPSVEISFSNLADKTQIFAERALICRFNGLWPRSKDLYDWISKNWTESCKVYFCAKGYFIVLFDNPEHYEEALEEGPWFMGSAGLFLTPWFPDFDPASAIITKAPVWIRLPNLPIHLWCTEVYKQIGNTLGRFLMGNYERELQGLYTYARICVELDLSKGLPEQINLKINDSVWTQFIDYENTAFRCRHCHLTGHLQNSCPSLSARAKKGIFAKSKPKRWAPCPPPPAGSSSSPSMVEEESSDEEEVDAEDMETKKAQVQPSMDHEELSVPPNSQKRTHESSPSDSDKESSPAAQLSLQIIPVQQSRPDWILVGKKKGKKCRIVDPTQAG